MELIFNEDIIELIISYLNYRCSVCQKKFRINDFNFYFGNNKKLYCSNICYNHI